MSLYHLRAYFFNLFVPLLYLFMLPQSPYLFLFFFLKNPPPPEISPLPLHAPLPIPRPPPLQHSPRQQSPPRHPCRNPLLRLPPRLRKRNPDIPVGLFSRCPIPHPKIPQQLSLPRPPIAIRHLQFRPNRLPGRCPVNRSTQPRANLSFQTNARTSSLREAFPPKNLSAALALCLLTSLLPSLSLAQGTGFPEFGSLQSAGFDFVNNQNLNVGFSIPVVSKPSRGFPFSFPISYNAAIWQKVDTGTALTWVQDPKYGWNYKAVIGGTSDSQPWDMDCGVGQREDIYTNYSYTEPNGTVHPFGLYINIGANCSYGARTGYATDG